VYLAKGKKHAIATATAADAAVTGLTSRIENVEPRLYMDSFFLFHDILHGLHMETINFSGTVRPN
jgi:hypothetical protein